MCFVMMCFANWSLPYTTTTRRFTPCDNLYTVSWTTQLQRGGDNQLGRNTILFPQGPSLIVVYLSNVVRLAEWQAHNKKLEALNTNHRYNQWLGRQQKNMPKHAGKAFSPIFAGMPWTDVSKCRGGSVPGPLGKGLGGVDEIVERNMNEKLDGKMSSIAWYSSPGNKIKWKVTLSKTPSSWLQGFQCIPLFTGRINQVATFEVSWQKYVRWQIRPYLGGLTSTNLTVFLAQQYTSQFQQMDWTDPIQRRRINQELRQWCWTCILLRVLPNRMPFLSQNL